MFINQGSAVHQLVEVKNVEKHAAFNNKQKHNMFLRKWSILENLLPQKNIFRHL